MDFDWLATMEGWDRSQVNDDLSGRPVESKLLSLEDIVRACGAEPGEDWRGALDQWITARKPGYDTFPSPPGTLLIVRDVDAA